MVAKKPGIGGGGSGGGGGGPFKRDPDKKQAADDRKAQREAEREAARKRKEKEARKRREEQERRKQAEKDKNKNKQQPGKTDKHPSRKPLNNADPKPGHFSGIKGDKLKPVHPTPDATVQPGKGQTLRDLMNSSFGIKDTPLIIDKVRVPRDPSRPGMLAGFADRLTPLHERPKPGLIDWQFGNIRQNAMVKAAQESIDRLRTDIPLMLIPLRLETRFTEKPPFKLRVRVYPDQFALDGLERRLSEKEIAAGKEFLGIYDRTEGQEDKASLWEAFCTASSDPWRASWIVRCLRHGKYEVRKDDEPGHPARAPVLPDCWLVTGRSGRETFHAAGNPIPPDLAFSPDFASDISPTGELAIDPAVKWMVDFGEAVRKGMALEIALPVQAQDRIDELFVVGIKTQGPDKDRKPLPPGQAGKMLEDLIEAHHYDWGAGFVPSGTATNNTASVRSEWAFNKPDVEALRLRELEPAKEGLSLPDIADDGDRALRPVAALAAASGPDTMFEQARRAFGLGEDSVLSRLEHRQGSERAAARAMNRLLWPVTLGETFEKLLSGPEGDNNVPDAAIEYTRTWFCNHVTGGNPLPALRSAATTYGVLPIESFTRRTPRAQSAGEAASREELGNRVRALLPEWREAIPRVLRLSEKPENVEGFGSPTDRYLGIIRQDANPAAFFSQQVWNLRDGPNWRYEQAAKIAHHKHNSRPMQNVFENRREVTFRLKLSDAVIESKDLDALFGRASAMGILAPNGDILGSLKLEWEFTFRADQLLSALCEGAGLQDYTVWPGQFRDGDHQEEELVRKRTLLEAMLDLQSELFDQDVEAELKTQGKTYRIERLRIPRNLLWEALVGAVESDVRAIHEALVTMCEVVSAHKTQNSQFVQAFNPPPDVYTGLVGEQDTDPQLSWLHYLSLTEWPNDQLVEVDKGADTVTAARYMAELAACAEAERLGEDAPAATAFPDGDKPLLYQLLYTAIRRTALMPDAAARAIDAEFDLQPLAGDGKLTLQPGQIGKLSDRIKGVGSTRAAPPDTGTAALQRTLASRKPEEMRALAKRLRADAKANAGKGKFPAKEAETLAAELDRIAKLPPAQLKPQWTGPFANTRAARLREMRDALNLLAGLNPAQIELLMQQTLGLASWRLDAWLTSLTTQRLFELRAEDKSPTGVHLGAFGWVEDLERDTRDATDAHAMRSQGFIHTPSLTHAKAAAVLRSGWNAYGDTRETSPLAVDLSSERMRFAQWAFAAVSRGQDPGDVLGREFERILRHVVDAPHWIFPIRQAVLTMVGEDPDPSLPVVDGLDLHAMWKADPDRLRKLARAELEGLGATDKLAFSPAERAIAKLAERIDAIADAGLADAMFALVQGNPDRAGAQLSAISDGIRGASELQILSTAPATVTQTHRVVMLAGDAGQAGWLNGSALACPFAAADPASEAIAARMIGDPERLNFRYQLTGPQGERLRQGEVRWSDLIAARSVFGGGALAVLASLSEAGWSQECEIAARLRGFLAARDAELLTGGRLDITPAQGTEAALDIIAAWREVVLGARALHPGDCGAEIEEGTALLDLGGLEERRAALHKAWDKPASRLLGMLPAPVDGDPRPVGTASPAQIRTELEGLLASGWSPALAPLLGVLANPGMAYDAVWSLEPKLRELQAELAGLAAEETAGDEEAGARRDRAMLRRIMGAKLACAANFLPADRKGFAKAINAAPARDIDAPLTHSGWLEKLAFVREPLRKLNDAILLAECDDPAGDPVALDVAQWPRGMDQPWIATAPPPERGGPTTSWLMVGGVPQAEPERPIAGIVIDEVIDKIPSNTTNTGVAVHFDAPNCEAPQSLLLALPPEGEKWSHEVLLDTLRDCFELARMRPVDSRSMSDFNPLLPAIWADNTLRPGETDVGA